MVTGIETAGLLLATLPLLVNQLDGYVRGFEKIRGLRSYRREINGYRIGLSAQHAILINTLELFLEEIVDEPDRLLDLIENPKGQAWKDAKFQDKLRSKLDRDYGVFVETTSGLSDLLEELRRKLGLGDADLLETPFLTRRRSDFRIIFSRAVYDDLLVKIDATNQILRTLTDQSYQRRQIRGSRRRKRELNAYLNARKHAESLYFAIIQGRCWKCLCSCQHLVHFQVDSKIVQNPARKDLDTGITRFTLVLSSSSYGNGSQQQHNRWHEVLAEPYATEPPDSSGHARDATSSTTTGTGTRVRFLPQASKHGSKIQSTDSSKHSQIDDLCSAVHAFDRACAKSNLLGYISEGADSKNQYNVRLLRDIKQGVHFQSLHEVLTASSNSHLPGYSSQRLSRRDRLFLAAMIASAVLQFHGTWLKQQWTLDDIKLPQDTSNQCTVIEHPYLSCQVLGSGSSAGSPICGDTYHHSVPNASNNSKLVVRNHVLFNLALCLIELSLGQPISALRQNSDGDPGVDLDGTRLATAARVLNRVHWESGSRYFDVVKECLYWSSSGGQEFDDGRFDEAVFNIVVAPLLRNFYEFEGMAYVE